MAHLSYTNAQAATRRALNEPTAQFWEDVEIQNWINQGARCISGITLCNWSSEDIALVQNQIEYVLAGNEAIKIESVVYDFGTADKGLQRIDFLQIGHNGSSALAEPKFYTFFENDIYIWPAPTLAIESAAKTCRVISYKIVDNYGADGSETLPDYIQRVAVDYAISCAWTKAGKHRLAGNYMQKFLGECRHFRRQIFDQMGVVDTKDSIKLPDYTVIDG